MLFVSCSLTVSQERPHTLSLLRSPASSSMSEIAYTKGTQKLTRALYPGTIPDGYTATKALHPSSVSDR